MFKFDYKIFLLILVFLFAGNHSYTFAAGKNNVKNTNNEIKSEKSFNVSGNELQPKSTVFTVTGNEKQGKVKSIKQTEFAVTGNELQPKSTVFAVTGNEKQGKVKSAKQTEFAVTGAQEQSVNGINTKETKNKQAKTVKSADSSKAVNVAEPYLVESSSSKKKNKTKVKDKENDVVVAESSKEVSKEDKAKRYMTFCSGNFFHFYGYEEEDKDKMDMEEYFKSFKETTKIGKTFEITGDEIGKKKETEFVVTGNEISKKHKQINQTKQSEELTDYQKAKLEYILMEEESKLFGLRRMLNVAKKLLYSELSKENYNLTVISNLKQEILSTASDIELVKFETECKIRGLLSLEQYKKLESKIQKRRSL